MESFHYDKFIEVPESDREGAREWLDRRLLEEGGEAIEDLELEKTPKDLEIIALCERAVSRYMKRYGRKKDIALPLKNIHVLKDDGVERYTQGRLFEGAHATTLGSVLVDRKKSDIEFALRLFHELTHAKSYQAIQIRKDGAVEMFRSGFSVVSRDGEAVWFVDLEEAVIGILTERFFKEVVREAPVFRDEVITRREGPYFGRQTEVTGLIRLVEELWRKNRSRFSNRGEVMEVFFDAQINGRLLRAARLIEATFGKGSFRRLGEAGGLDEKREELERENA